MGPGATPCAHEAGERGDLAEVVDDGGDVPGEHLFARAAVVTAHHEDRRDDPGLAELDRLFDQGDAEAVDASPLERARNGRRAVAVRVGLEHRPDTRAVGVATDDAQVVAQRLEVDLGARGPQGVGGSGAAGAEDAGDQGLGHRGENAGGGGADSGR